MAATGRNHHRDFTMVWTKPLGAWENEDFTSKYELSDSISRSVCGILGHFGKVMCTNWQAFADHGRSNDISLNHLRWKRRYADEASPNNMWFTSEVIPIFQTIWFCDVLRWKVGQQKIGASILWQVHVTGMIRRQPFKVIFKYFNYFQTRSLGSSSTIVCIPEVCEYTPFCC